MSLRHRRDYLGGVVGFQRAGELVRDGGDVIGGDPTIERRVDVDPLAARGDWEGCKAHVVKDRLGPEDDGGTLDETDAVAGVKVEHNPWAGARCRSATVGRAAPVPLSGRARQGSRAARR